MDKISLYNSLYSKTKRQLKEIVVETQEELQEARELLVQTSDYLELINLNKEHKRDIDKFLDKGEE